MFGGVQRGGRRHHCCGAPFPPVGTLFVICNAASHGFIQHGTTHSAPDEPRRLEARLLETTDSHCWSKINGTFLIV